MPARVMEVLKTNFSSEITDVSGPWWSHHATSASTNTLLVTLLTHTAVGVLVQPTMWGVHVWGREGRKKEEQGIKERGREGGREEEIHNVHKWTHIPATHSASLISDHHLTPNSNLEPSGRDTTEQFCTQRRRYWKFRHPSHCVSLAPQQLNMESHCSWHTNDSLTEWEGNKHSH